MNSPIQPSDLQTEFAKDFATDDPTALQNSIDRAYRQIGDAWGELADDGALYLAAHLRIVAKRGATGLPMQSKKVGEVSVSYVAPPAFAAGSLSSTAYGMEFLRMLYNLPEARVNVDPSDNFYEHVPAPDWNDGGIDGF